MPNSDKSFVNPFSLVGRFFSWFFGQFPDTVLIAMSVLGAGLLVIGSLYFIGHMSPKEPVVNMDHVYHDAYRIDPVPVHVPVHHQVPVHSQSVHTGFTYPQHVYHQSGHHHHASHQGQYSNYQHYNRHLSLKEAREPAQRVHSSRLSPYASHRFGRPRTGSPDDIDSEDKTFDYFNSGSANAHNY